jgi:hypothetical protein
MKFSWGRGGPYSQRTHRKIFPKYPIVHPSACLRGAIMPAHSVALSS